MKTNASDQPATRIGLRVQRLVRALENAAQAHRELADAYLQNEYTLYSEAEQKKAKDLENRICLLQRPNDKVRQPNQ